MGIENEKPMHPSLMTPGRDDLSPWPPVGQLEFKQIIGMEEEQLDRAIMERHGLNTVLAKLGENERLSSKKAFIGRRVEIKRIALALLEGHPAAFGSELADWTDAHAQEPEFKTIYRYLNQECKERIVDVKRRVAREAVMMRPTKELADQMDKINRILKKHGTEIKIAEIFNSEHVPPLRVRQVDISRALSIFLMKIEGFSGSEIVGRLGIKSEKLLSVISTQMFSSRAKEIIDEVLGTKYQSKVR